MACYAWCIMKGLTRLINKGLKKNKLSCEFDS